MRDAIYAAQPEKELKHCIGMSRTAGTISEEIQTLFAVAEAHERSGKTELAANVLRQIVTRYGANEYAISSLFSLGPDKLARDAGIVLDYGRALFGSHTYGREARAALGLLQEGLPLYSSTVSPVISPPSAST